MFFPFVTFALFSLFSVAVLGVFWTSVAVMFLAPVLIGVSVFTVGSYFTYYAARRVYSKYNRPLILNRFRRGGSKDPAATSKSGTSSDPYVASSAASLSTARSAAATAALTAAQNMPNGAAPAVAAKAATPNGRLASRFAKYRASDLVNKIAPGRIVHATSDKGTNKKNWWKFVNKMDATVYMSEGERDELYRRINEVREKRQYERKKAEDSFSDVKDDEDNAAVDIGGATADITSFDDSAMAGGAAGSTTAEADTSAGVVDPSSITIFTPELVGSATSNYGDHATASAAAEDDEEDGDEGYGEGVPPYRDDAPAFSQGY